LIETLNVTLCIDSEWKPSVKLKLEKLLHLERRVIPDKNKGVIDQHLEVIDLLIARDLLPQVIFLKVHPRDPFFTGVVEET